MLCERSSKRLASASMKRFRSHICSSLIHVSCFITTISAFGTPSRPSFFFLFGSCLVFYMQIGANWGHFLTVWLLIPDALGHSVYCTDVSTFLSASSRLSGCIGPGAAFSSHHITYRNLLLLGLRFEIPG